MKPIHWVLIAAWGIYFSLHSFFALPGIKRTFRKVRYYRLVYALFSTLALFALFVFNAVAGGERFFQSAGIVRYLSLACATFGVIVIRLAFREYSLGTFLGTAPETEEELKTTGILSYIRHPLYAGTLLLTAGYFLFTPDLATALSGTCVVVYLIIGIRIEENRLVRKFGDHYRAYRKRVPAIVPRRI